MDNNTDWYEEKIREANNLIELLINLSHVKGISKLKKLIKAERTFLHRAFIQTAVSSEKQQIKKNLTTNLTHFDALVTTALEMENCCAVLEPFYFQLKGDYKRVVVDIVRDEGKEWIKVTARSPKGLMMSCLGDTSYGSRTILDQAKDFVECASQNPVLYIPPKIVFKFSSGIDSALASNISDSGVEIVGQLLQSSYNSLYDNSDESDERGELFSLPQSKENIKISISHPRKPVTKLNLDTTTLIAYVSNMTNGGTCKKFKQEPLTLQANSEKTVKVKDILDALFEGKELYCCETAVTRFKEILEVVGGENEKARAVDILQRLTVVPDCVSEKVRKLKRIGQIKDRPQIVFGSGDSMQAVTVSANYGFCRSAQHQGINLATFLHEPRALSEQASVVNDNTSS